MKRKGLSKKLRFEVFKRDKFTCQYCGRKAPDIILVCDHVSPVVKGGKDTLLNLITSCCDCNSGKGPRTLDDSTAVAVQRAELDRLAERREQIDMLMKWSEGMQDQHEYEVEAFAKRWHELTGNWNLNETGREEASKRLRKFNLQDLLTAMTTAISQYGRKGEDGNLTQESVELAWRKIPGIVRVSKLPQDERDLYYIRGILRNRLHYVSESECMSLLRDALRAGYDVNDLKQMARETRNWTNWRAEMLELLKEDEPGSDAG